MSTTAGPPAAVRALATKKPSRSGSCTSSNTASGLVRCDSSKGFRSVRSFAGNDVPRALEQLPGHSTKRLVVVDDQHPFHVFAIVAHGCRNDSGFSLESRNLSGISNQASG